MRLTKTFLLAICFLCAACTLPAQAAELFVSPTKPVVAVASEFSVDLFVNTTGQEINAVEATVYFPDSFILRSIASGSSVISYWVRPPTVVKSDKPGFAALVFSGLSPGGITTDRGRLITLNFLAAANQQKTYLVSVEKARVLLNDGNGTAAALTIKNATISLSKEVATSPEAVDDVFKNKDTTPPDPFIVAISQNSDLFNNQWFVAFVATDKESGIDHFDIQESKSDAPEESKWQLATNPFVLKDQSLRSYIFVRAVDRMGNTRVELLKPPTSKYYSYAKVAISCILCIAVVAFAVRLFRATRRQKNHVDPPPNN